MADLFDFMLGKKDDKRPVTKTEDEKTNYSIFMPVGVYDGSEDDVPPKNNEGKSDSTPSSRREDFSFYDTEKLSNDEQLVLLKRELVEQEDEVKRLHAKISDLQNKNNALLVEKSRYEYIKNSYRTMLETIVNIMPYYQEIEFTGIGVPEQWKDKELVEFFIKCINDIKVKYNKSLKDIESYKTKLANSVASNTQNNVPKDDVQPKQGTITDMGIDIDIPDDLENELFNSNNSSKDLFDKDIDIDLNISDDDIPDIDMDSSTISNIGNEHLVKYKEKLDDDASLKTILETIGSTGLSRIVDLKELERLKNHFTAANGEFSQGLLSKKIQILLDMSILDKETINTGRKGGYEHIYSLGELGVSLYKMLFNKAPVENEKEAVKRQHTSLEHGYFIKTVAKELIAKDYTVYDSPADCVKKPIVSKEAGDENLRVEADLIAVKGDTEFIIECEMGTTSDSDMSKKLDKLVLVTKVISFIMNNNDSLNATSSKVDKWISKNGGPKNFKGYTFRFTTIDTFKKREVWQNKGPF